MKYLILGASLLSLSMINAQQNNVGINTKTPQGALHIDPQKNTPASGSTDSQTKDDFIVTNTNGWVGIGNLSPKVRVDLRNPENDNALAVGDTNQTAAAAGKGAIRYVVDGSTGHIEYSNGVEWVRLKNTQTTKSVVIATKTSPKSAMYEAGGNASSQNPSCTIATSMSGKCYIDGIPNRTSAFLTDWTSKVDNNVGGSFDPTTGIFTANREGTFTATFTFATESGKLRSYTTYTNQIEAIWRVYNAAGTEINSVKCANTFPSDSRDDNNTSGSVKVGSSCTASIKLNPGEYIRPALWVDLIWDNDPVPNYNTTQSGGTSLYNNLTIVEN